MKNPILIAVLSAVLVLTTVGKRKTAKTASRTPLQQDNCEDTKFQRSIHILNHCRAKGYASKLEGCLWTKRGHWDKKHAKTCFKAEKKLKKCGYICDHPIDGGWSEFGAWSVCSVECGGGIQRRTRNCSNPEPAFGGAECDGVSDQVESCNLQDCPVDGGWSDFEDWSDCSAECGGGTQTRTRTCSNPEPALGGADCEGESSEVQECNQQDCLTTIIQTAITAAWAQVPGGLTRISKGNSGIWGVNANDNIYMLNT